MTSSGNKHGREAMMEAQSQYEKEASVDLIMDLVAQRLKAARLTFEHATPHSLYYRVGNIRIRISDRGSDVVERMWEREHDWFQCVQRDYIVTAAIDDEPEVAELLVEEILDDLPVI
jgi:hypothetical protein